MSEKITFLSYNICHGEGMDDQVDLSRTAAVIARELPDFVAIQEVDCCAQRTHGVDQAAELGRLTGYQEFFGKSIPFQGGEYGICVLTKTTGNVQALHLPLPGAEPRSLLIVRGRTARGTELLFGCTHLALEEEARVASARKINEWATGQSLPVVLMGDFNCGDRSECYRLFAETWRSVWTGEPLPTFPAPAPRVAIDHLFMYPRDGWTVVSAEVLDEPLASDHRPLQVVLERQSGAR